MLHKDTFMRFSLLLTLLFAHAGIALLHALDAQLYL